MSRPRQSWPALWIIIAIVAAIIPYTYVRLHFRKPTNGYQPYHDFRDRVNTQRLLSAGFQRIPLESERPAEGLSKTGSAVIAAAPGGLPPALDETLVAKPVLPNAFSSVNAVASASVMFAYAVDFTCTLNDNKQDLSDVYLYAREGQLYIIPSFERLAGDLLSRNRELGLRVKVPAGALKPGSYTVTLVGAQASKTWSLQLK
jgi:hypothetical protein